MQFTSPRRPRDLLYGDGLEGGGGGTRDFSLILQSTAYQPWHVSWCKAQHGALSCDQRVLHIIMQQSLMIIVCLRFRGSEFILSVIIRQCPDGTSLTKKLKLCR